MPTLLRDRDRRSAAALLTTLVLLAAGLGCKSARLGGPASTPKPTPPGLWSTATIDNGWITVTVGLPHRAEPPYPVVLSPIVPDHRLLARGIGVVRWEANWAALKAIPEAESPAPSRTAAPDDPEHVGVWLLRSSRPGLIGRTYFQLISVNAHRNVPAVVDYLEDLPMIDPDRIAISGSSTGGFTALQAMAAEPRLALATVQVACGEYHLFLRSSSLALDDRERWLVDGEMVLDQDYEAEIQSIDPVRRVHNFPPRPLLLITGAQDRAIPAACVHASAARFSAAYEHAGVPERFEWVEFEDRGHNLGPEASTLVLDFLERWLEVQDSARGL